MKKMLKKILFLIFLVGFNNAIAQIKLIDDSVHPANEIKKQSLNSETLKSLVGYGMYTATILGYAEFCQLAKEEQKIIFDNFFDKLKLVSLTEEENKLIANQFMETAKIAKEKGVSNSNINCPTFKIEFDHIIKSIKDKK